jgi:hypothetical protein
MSRIEKHTEGYGLAYGLDYATGLFIQVWKIPENEDDRKALQLFGCDSDDLVVDKDEMFHRINPSVMIRVANCYGFTLTDDEIMKLYSDVRADM